ncbi:MAG: acyl-CoA thioesterase [Planctomycetota bacterium]|jgi:acyl-CoA thioester hydrolase
MPEGKKFEPFEMEIPVDPADIDLLGHVSNIVYLRWVQDVAVAHWNAKATEKDKEELLWVVTRHEIDYKRPAMAGDTVIARTWVGGALKGIFERHTEIRRKSDGKVLARARSLWCPVDARTKKPTRVSADVYETFTANMIRSGESERRSG